MKRTKVKTIQTISIDTSQVLGYDSITVSSAWELTSVSMRYSQWDGVKTSLSRLMYCRK